MALIRGATNGPDRLQGTAGDDTYRALDGDDTLIDFGGGDLFDGGDGQDTILLDAIGRTTGIFLTDRVINVVVDLDLRTQSDGGIVGDADGLISIENYTHFGNFNYVIRGNEADNVLKTDRGMDILDGRDGADRLFSGGQSDTLDGGAGRDLLDAGAGDDFMTGGGGADRFVYNKGDGFDYIYDFADTDTASDDLLVISRAMFRDMVIDSDRQGTLLDFGNAGAIYLQDAVSIDRTDFLLA